MDIASRVRPDFPILTTPHPSGKPLIYLDSAATSQKPQAVLDAILQYYTHDNANVHRGIHELGDRSTKVWHAARTTIARFFGATSQELVMVRNTTEAINLIAHSYAPLLSPGSVILTTQLDHHSNIVPWQEVAKQRQSECAFIPVTAQGQIDLDWLAQRLHNDAGSIRVLALPHVSNALGTITPLPEIVAMVREYDRRTGGRCLIVVDGAQAAPHLPIDFAALDVDCYAVSAHKMLGPMGVGGLFVRSALLTTLKPHFTGGGMIHTVSETQTTYSNDLEERFTPGTPDVAGAVGWAAACTYLETLGMEAVAAHDRSLVDHALMLLQAVPKVTVVGPLDPALRCGSVTFVYQGVHAHDVAQILDSEGVAVRSGHHCTMPLHTAMGWQATTRMSFSVYTSKEEVSAAVGALAKVDKVFHG